MIVLDTNLLIYLHRSDTPEHKRTVRAVTRALPLGLATTTINVVEFATVVTALAKPSTANDCSRFLSQLACEILSPQSHFAERLFATPAVRGRRLHDLAIAIIADSHGASAIWTNDAAFVSTPGLPVYLPLTQSQ